MGSQPEQGGNIHASVLPFPCGIPQAFMEILPEMKAESSICCFNQILNLTPSAKNLGYRIDVKRGTGPGGKRKRRPLSRL